MKERLLGMFSWFGFPLPLSERLELIARAGFTVTCLWLGDEEEQVATGLAEQMPALARRVGLSIDNVHAPFLPCNGLWSENPEVVQGVIDLYGAAVQYCERHHIPTVVIHLSRSKVPAPLRREGLDALGMLIAQAERRGVTVAVENTRCTLHLEAALRHIPSRHLGWCYDSSHDFISDGEPCDLLLRWGERLKTVHLSDNEGTEDDHYLPGQGRIDWPRVSRAFPKSSYPGPILLEVFPRSNTSTTPEAFTRLAFDCARSLQRQLAPPDWT